MGTKCCGFGALKKLCETCNAIKWRDICPFLLSKNSFHSRAFLPGVFRPIRARHLTYPMASYSIAAVIYISGMSLPCVTSLDQPQKMSLHLVLLCFLMEMKTKSVRIGQDC